MSALAQLDLSSMRALHVEVAFGHVVVFAFQDLLEAANGIGHRNLLALAAGEHLRHAERLAQEALNLARTEHRHLVLRRKLIHAENRDDILQVFEALEHLLHAARNVVVLLAHDFRRERAGGRGQRIHRRIDAQFGNRTLQDDGRVQVRERRGRRRVGQVVGRHVHRLEGSDRAFLGGGDAFLEGAHFGGERRLVTDGAGGAAEQRRHLGAGLRKPEDVVDEEQHILILLVAEVFGDGEAGQGHAQAGARRFVHLAVHQGDLGRAQVVLLDDPRFGHFVVEVVPFAGALSDAGEHRHAAVELGDIVDQLHDDDRLADAGAAERAHFPAFQEGADQINDFDAGGEHLRRSRLVHERGRGRDGSDSISPPEPARARPPGCRSHRTPGP